MNTHSLYRRIIKLLVEAGADNDQPVQERREPTKRIVQGRKLVFREDPEIWVSVTKHSLGGGGQYIRVKAYKNLPGAGSEEVVVSAGSARNDMSDPEAVEAALEKVMNMWPLPTDGSKYATA